MLTLCLFVCVGGDLCDCYCGVWVTGMNVMKYTICLGVFVVLCCVCECCDILVYVVVS